MRTDHFESEVRLEMAKVGSKATSEEANAQLACGLTTKQRRYVQSRISGFGPSDAYKRAYNTTKMKANTIYKEAHKLEQHPKIAPHLARYQQAMFDAQIQADIEQVALTKFEIINGLRLNARLARDRGDFGASNKALELLGKIDATAGFVGKPSTHSQSPCADDAQSKSRFDEFLRDVAGEWAEEVPASALQD